MNKELVNLNILYIESDNNYAKKIIEYLDDLGIEYIWSKSKKDALKDFYLKNPNLIITEIELLDGNSFELIKKIKYENESIPILILTSNQENKNLIEAIKLKIDNYLLKPIRKNSFVEELSSVNFNNNFVHNKYHLGEGFIFDIYNLTLYGKDELKIDLTNQETLLLKKLILEKDSYVPYIYLQTIIAKRDLTSINSLRTNIKQIRKKTYSDIIKNLSGVGYKINICENANKKTEKKVAFETNTNILILDSSKKMKIPLEDIEKNNFFNIFYRENVENLIDFIKSKKIMLLVIDFAHLKTLKEDISKEIPIIPFLSKESLYELNDFYCEISNFLVFPFEKEELYLKIRLSLKNHIQELKHKNKDSILQNLNNAINDISIVSKTDCNGNITYVNEKLCKVSGYSEEELLSKNHNIFRHQETKKETHKDIWNTIKKRKNVWSGTLKNKTKNNKTFEVKSHILPILDINGEVQEYIALRSLENENDS